jgi:hypothetical protein
MKYRSNRFLEARRQNNQAAPLSSRTSEEAPATANARKSRWLEISR